MISFVEAMQEKYVCSLSQKEADQYLRWHQAINVDRDEKKRRICPLCRIPAEKMPRHFDVCLKKAKLSDKEKFALDKLIDRRNRNKL